MRPEVIASTGATCSSTIREAAEPWRAVQWLEINQHGAGTRGKHRVSLIKRPVSYPLQCLVKVENLALRTIDVPNFPLHKQELPQIHLQL